MYAPLLVLHSILRWVVVILAALAVVGAVRGWQGGLPWGPPEDTRAKWLAITLDVQFVVGLLLYAVFSPITTAALQDFGGAMREPTLRFFAVEHTSLMVVALALVHVGKVRAAKAATAAAKHRTAAIFFGVALLAMLIATPWPFSSQVRPWIRLGL